MQQVADTPLPLPYSCTHVPVYALSAEDQQAMEVLYLAHYCQTSGAIFSADLAAKHEDAQSTEVKRVWGDAQRKFGACEGIPLDGLTGSPERR